MSRLVAPSGGRSSVYNRHRWLWVPAFAGTTKAGEELFHPHRPIETALGCRRRLFDKPVAQGADAGDLDLDDVAGFDVGRGAIGAHPDHVARPQRKIFRQFDDEWFDAEDHVVGAEAIALPSVHFHDGFHLVE